MKILREQYKEIRQKQYQEMLDMKLQGKTFDEIAHQFGVTNGRIQQILKGLGYKFTPSPFLVCSYCHIEKIKEEFSLSKKGYPTGVCKTCRPIRNREYYLAHKKRMIHLSELSKKRYPSRQAARMKAYKHFPTPQKCEVEGCENIGQRHHDDYSKPLEIRWICRKHHVRARCPNHSLNLRVS